MRSCGRSLISGRQVTSTDAAVGVNCQSLTLCERMRSGQCGFTLKNRNAVAFNLGSSLENLTAHSFRGFELGIGLQHACLALSRSVSSRQASAQRI